MTRLVRSSRLTLSPAAVRRLYPETREVLHLVLGRRVVRRLRAGDLDGVPAPLVPVARAALAGSAGVAVWLIRADEGDGGVGLLITGRRRGTR